MLNNIVSEILQNLIYSIILWCIYHKRLIETFDVVYKNIKEFKTYLKRVITDKIVFTYETSQSLDYIILIVRLISNSAECMIKYENNILNYISTLTNNINQIPSNITGVVFVWKPKRSKNLFEILNDCHEITRFILIR